MNPDRLKRLPPLERLLYWVREREAVRLRKESGAPPPWTDDPILRRYRFCNVRRMDDRVSRWLLDNWYGPHRGHPQTLKAVALARFFNLPDTLAECTGLVFRAGGKWDGAALARRLRSRRAAGHKLFNAAYMVRGNDGVDKVESVLTYNVASLTRARVRPDPKSMETTHARVAAVHGFGSFMAGQVTADLRWAVDGDWADRHDWAPLGPGSRRGANLLLGRPESAALTQAGFLVVLRGLMDAARRALPPGLADRLEAMDYQNCLCEFSKYERALWGRGRPKHNYPGEG